VTSDVAVIVPGVIGSICLIAVCVVYLRRQSLRLDGALLAVCGLALLGLAYWQAMSLPRVAPDLAGRLDAISEALSRLEGQIAHIADDQARLTADGFASNQDAQGGEPGDASTSQSLEIEVLGGVSDQELVEIVGWIRQVRSEHRSARILIEPVIPLGSADPAGQRKRLMNEAGRVIDHVFDELNQRVDIANLVSEDVPGPRLRLGF
jgi:hypothetical protein